jgi:hypothetical protein
VDPAAAGLATSKFKEVTAAVAPVMSAPEIVPPEIAAPVIVVPETSSGSAKATPTGLVFGIENLL